MNIHEDGTDPSVWEIFEIEIEFIVLKIERVIETKRLVNIEGFSTAHNVI